MVNLIDSLSFGDPWRLSEKAVSVVVPILRVGAGERNYVLLEEVKDKVKITDTGQIGRAKVENKSDKNVFMRKGLLLEGATQSRGVVSGTVIPPQKILEVEIQCVYASKGIRAGAVFDPAGIAPRSVENSFRRSQGATWSAVNRYTASALSSSGFGSSTRGEGFTIPRVSPDNLIGVMMSTQKFREDVDKVLEKVPGDLVNQVGIAVLDINGVVGVEVFDHPDSWRAFSKSIIRNYGDALTKEQEAGLFEIKMENVVAAVRNFLSKLSKAKRVPIHGWTAANKSWVSETYALEEEDAVGEYTAISGETIHLIGSRKEEQEEPRQRAPQLILSGLSGLPRTQRSPSSTALDWQEPATSWTTDPFFLRRKASTKLLDNLSQNPLTWKSLAENMDVSTKTLSSRLKEAKSLGLVEQFKRENGKQVYGLTPKGWETLKKAKAE